MRQISILILLTTRVAFGGFELGDGGARAKALGNAYLGLADDVWSIYFNVGGLASLSKNEVSFFYSPRQFGMSELSYSLGALAIPTGFGVVGLGARRYGFDLYREFSGTISYANTVSGAGIGVSFNYHTVTIRSYGSAGTIGIDIGVLIPVMSQVRWGISAKNINGPTVGSSSEKLPQTFSTGIAYFPIENLSLAFDYQKETRFDASPRFGFEYHPIDAVAFRAGVSDEPSQYSGGLGIRYSAFQVDYAFTAHQELGWTHAASVTISWGGPR